MRQLVSLLLVSLWTQGCGDRAVLNLLPTTTHGTAVPQPASPSSSSLADAAVKLPASSRDASPQSPAQADEPDVALDVSDPDLSGAEPAPSASNVPEPTPGPSADEQAEQTPDAAIPPVVTNEPQLDAPDATAPTPVASVDAGLSSPSSLLHRYSFTEQGSVAFDSVGGAHGELLNGAVISDGNVLLDGAGAHVWLPDGLISQLQSGTIMAWGTWNGGGAWQRLWDFGSFLETEDGLQEAAHAFFLTPLQGSDVAAGPAVFLEFRGELRGTVFTQEYLVASSQTRTLADVEYHYAAIVDESALTMSFYINGQFVAERSLQIGASGAYFLLSDLVDNNNSLGQSQYELDANFEGAINEFRIYGRALDAEEIAAAYAAGPDLEARP